MGKFVFIVLNLLYIFFSISIISGQTSDIKAKLNPVEQLFAKYNLPESPGIAVAITKDKEVIYTGGFGEANIEHRVKITANTLFDLASLAKPFTGMAIAMLVEQNKLDLNDDIRMYLPHVPDFGVKITIDHLVHHTSGIRDWVATLTIAGRTESDVITGRHIWKFIENQNELNFRPGDKFSYSNTNYFLLAELISKVTGQPFSKWLDENIFTPLNMDNTYILDNYTAILHNKAYPYKLNDNGKYATVPSNLSSVGSSSMFSSVNDLTNWMVNFENPVVGGNDVIVRTQQVTALNNGQEVPYAFGLNIGYFYDIPQISHGGWWQGYRSNFIRFPTRNISIVVLTNCIDIDPDRLVSQIAMILFDIKDNPGEVSKEIKVPEKIEMDPSVFDKYCGKYSCPMGETAFTVFKENNKLFMQCTGYPLNSSIPVAENKFYNLPENEYILFKMDKSGNADQLTVQYLDGGEASFKKVDFTPLKDEVDEICGVYSCPELKTEYYLHIKGKTLIASHFQNEDVVLSQELTNMFIGDKWWFKRIIFIRDMDNHVTGFRLDADNWRLNKLLFLKTGS